MKRTFTIAILLCFVRFYLFASDPPEKKLYTTTSIEGVAEIIIDGNVDDEVWQMVPWTMEFTQWDPDNGAAPARQTRFKVLYDDEYIFFGFHCIDPDPEMIVKRMSRRDGFPGDWVEVNIDSYFDKQTAFSFTSSVSGVKGDEFVTGNGNNWDTNWNPIWQNKTQIVEDGWTAEFKIPLSQLRYGNKENHVWGLQVMRRDFRAGQRSTWQHIPRNSSGYVSNFGELHGIRNIRAQRQVEIQPYVLASVKTSEEIEGDPFNDGFKSNFEAGLDGKIGITSDLTMDFTINPDFGQVEADPSTLTLDGFQIFFEEKRPFFIEGNNLFGFGVSQAIAGGQFNNDNLFYSRRIGQRPKGGISVPENAFTSRPEFTSILGAAKFSGKTKKGWSVGILEGVTSAENLKIDVNGEQSDSRIEPFSNYFISRISRDVNDNQTVFGAMLTSVNRKLDGTGLDDQFHHNAITGGGDIFHSWKNREWQVTGNFIFSRVAGTAARIQQTQNSFEHYYQRPGAGHLGVDSTRTSLHGHGGNLSIGSHGGADNVSFQTGVTWRSPGLELNDVGFLNTADEINHYFWSGYRSPSAVSIFNRLSFNYNHWLRWTFGGMNTYQAINLNAHASFKNFWFFSMGSTIEFKDISTKALFGGPALRNSSGIAPWISFGSDQRKNFNVSFHTFRFMATGQDKGSVKVQNYQLNFNFQPIDALNINLSPRYFQQDRVIQNVAFAEFAGESRYITGTVQQKTFSMSLRLNFNLTPNLTIQYWGQPFASRAKYTDYKYITDPLANRYQDRFQLYSASQINSDSDEGLFLVDEDLDGLTDYEFGEPDLHFLQFQSNMVIRWEYRTGSELFLVWSQSNTNLGDPGKGLIHSLQDDLFSNQPTNIFLFKWTYRFLN